MIQYPLYSRSEAKYCGRLIAVATNQNTLEEYEATGGKANLVRGDRPGPVTVEFPCMPEEIALTREAQYMAQPNMVTPDGLHLYQLTKPLEIPVKFKLYGSDPEYCSKDGPATLLAIAARLHAFTLPINTGKTNFLVNFNYTNVKTEASVKAEAKDTPANEKPIAMHLIGQEVIRPPATCVLELIRLSDQTDRMGIHCRGYVKTATVRFYGPWLRGSGAQFNIPTSAEYDFTFVHVPSHQNDYGRYKDVPSKQEQAFAHDVIGKFYNTLSLNNFLSAQGFDLAKPDDQQATAETVTSTAAPPNVLPHMTPEEVGFFEQFNRWLRPSEDPNLQLPPAPPPRRNNQTTTPP